MMKIGNYEFDKEDVSVALIILFALIAMFFLGYKFAYNQAIAYANEQIEELTPNNVLGCQDFSKEIKISDYVIELNDEVEQDEIR